MRLTNALCKIVHRMPRSPSNFPERYIKKQTDFIEWETPKLPNYKRGFRRWRDVPYYDVHRPWTQEFQDMNSPMNFIPKIHVQPFNRFPVMRGDRVQIMVGRDEGKQGIVDYVVEERNWVCVEGLNLEYKLQHADSDFPGMLQMTSSPLMYPSEVTLVDPTDKKPTLAEWRYDDNGDEVRVSCRTERVLPIPIEAFTTVDYKSRELYVEEDKDTTAKDVEKITYVAKAKTFEMDIMEEMGIEEDRVPHPMYWY